MQAARRRSSPRQRREGGVAAWAIADQLRRDARYGEADHVYRQAIAEATRLAQEHGSLPLADLLTGRGVLQKELGHYAEAERLYRRALAIVEREAPRGDARLADLYHNLGGLEHARARPSRGEAFARKAVTLRAAALGENCFEVAADVAALAAILDAQGKYDEAETLYKRALAIFRRTRSEFDIAVTLNNLAALYQARGQAERPERLYKKALALKERLFGPVHPETATTLNNLALFYRALGRYAEARRIYERVVRILEEALGPAHPSTTTALYNYAQLLKAQALDLEERVAQVERDREEIAGADPPLILAEFACFRLIARPSRIHRWGVYTEEDIPARRKVIEYTGERVSRREIVRRTAGNARVYVFSTERYWGIDGAVGGSGAEYINHSCDPNLYSRMCKGHVLYVSRRAIRAGEELTVDYRLAGDRKPCYCGAPNCSGTMNLAIR